MDWSYYVVWLLWSLFDLNIIHNQSWIGNYLFSIIYPSEKETTDDELPDNMEHNTSTGNRCSPWTPNKKHIIPSASLSKLRDSLILVAVGWSMELPTYLDDSDIMMENGNLTC